MRFWFVILLLPLLVSCISHSTLFHGVDEPSIRIDSLSGTYANDPEENEAPLAYSLSRMRRKFREDEFYKDVKKVMLDYAGGKELAVSLYNDSLLIDTFALRVENHGNYLEIRPKLRLVPIPILFWFHEEKQCILMNDPSGNLVVSNAQFHALLFLTMARSKKLHCVADYARQDSIQY